MRVGPQPPLHASGAEKRFHAVGRCRSSECQNSEEEIQTRSAESMLQASRVSTLCNGALGSFEVFVHIMIGVKGKTFLQRPSL